ncbi:hypothetical protein BOX37_28035 [Nocardia mangyaensis]|jgi:ectoine hydroxylase-related dioxygenase (phytanoyl-CoA dioxygenase family)|uniref:Phytanoyl-CoA dioxygenase n=1 Tax=Nocardia mangyaensis TaxID=2213200 RepID=A0A1J0VYQ6_9NOCA|nr:phytanoyl-CoA dioxygenase family protein [Nocardia mangyaensis]APE37141.1 hypothetical protein BOX37_28035 [Nocardia mangyaensis]
MHQQLTDHGLLSHALELEALGYTVIPDALEPDLRSELTEQLLACAAADDAPVDTESGGCHRDRTQEVPLLLSRGGAPFQELVLGTRTLLLITYLLGAQRQLSSVTGYVKGPGLCALGIHSDTAYVPDPLPPYAQIANINYCLTDYTEANGCLSIVPGSHRFCHRPREGQGTRDAIPVLAPAGAAIIFHGNTWHGAYPRTEPGVRLTISTLFARMYMRPQEDYARVFTADEIKTMAPQLAELIGASPATGWADLPEFDDITTRRRTRAPSYYLTRAQHG